ncbi:hypothetical protein [Deferrisoma camini]|uniref:hypothetical protein n=1 Tax=Deferrisoma camini TaxID=1035120 RepID=UPI00046D52BE|nr:hypothetical protein [Deferrisoma camini]
MSQAQVRARADLVSALEREADAARALAGVVDEALAAVHDPRRLEEAIRRGADAARRLERAARLRQAAAARWARSARQTATPRPGGPEAHPDSGVADAARRVAAAIDGVRSGLAALGLAARFGLTVTEHLVRTATGAGYGPGGPSVPCRTVCQA